MYQHIKIDDISLDTREHFKQLHPEIYLSIKPFNRASPYGNILMCPSEHFQSHVIGIVE